MRDPTLRCYDHVAIRIIVLDVDEDGVPRYAFLNHLALEGIGLRPDQILGRTADNIYPLQYGLPIFERQKAVAATGIAQTYELEMPLFGEIRLLRTTLTPVVDDDDVVVRLVGTSWDITEDQKTRELQANLSTVTSEIEQFVTMAAHDLRTPMNNVAALAEMLRDGFEDHGDGKLELIDMLENVAQKSAILISDVLAHARATTTQPALQPFDFGDMCKNLADILDPLGAHHFNWFDGTIRGDKTAYQIVLRNLIDNALKHANRPSLNIDISLRAASDGLLQIALQDNGQGFENPGKAFLDNGEFRVDSGYGLLGIHRLITSRGGEISVTNSPNAKGCTMQFSLPGVFEPIAPALRA
ncbi:MAG: ATP-binding protein [Sulfitobacter sp.]